MVVALAAIAVQASSSEVAENTAVARMRLVAAIDPILDLVSVVRSVDGEDFAPAAGGNSSRGCDVEGANEADRHRGAGHVCAGGAFFPRPYLC